MMRGFCPEGAYVLMELCMEGVLSKGVLSEGVLSKGVMSGGGFVLPSTPSGLFGWLGGDVWLCEVMWLLDGDVWLLGGVMWLLGGGVWLLGGDV